MNTTDANRKTVMVGARGEASTNHVESRHTLFPGRIVVSDKDGTPTPLFPLDEPAMTGAEIVWTGLLLEQHHLQPLEFPERTADRHLIALYFRPATLEWFLGGHSQIKRMRRGSLDIIPQGTLLGGYSQDETEFLMLALAPSFVEHIVSESGARDSLITDTSSTSMVSGRWKYWNHNPESRRTY